MFYGEVGSGGACPASGTHDGSTSAPYAVIVGGAAAAHDKGSSAHYAIDVDPGPLSGIVIDVPSITFPDPIPVGGWSRALLSPDGSCRFSGHFHNSGAGDFDGSTVLAVATNSGTLFTFAHRWRVEGTSFNPFSAPNRDADWDLPVANPEVKERWAQLSEGYTLHHQSQTSLDVGSLIENIKQAVDTIVKIVEVVAVIA